MMMMMIMMMMMMMNTSLTFMFVASIPATNIKSDPAKEIHRFRWILYRRMDKLLKNTHNERYSD